MKIVNAEEMKIIDSLASAEYAVPGLLLMDAAAKQVADVVQDVFEDAPRVVCFCGGGNNGGDGIGAARWLLNYGLDARVFLVGTEEEKLVGDAAQELAMYKAAGGRVDLLLSEEDWLGAELAAERADILVDAILGTGFTGELRSDAERACKLINAAEKYVVAVDLPSGVHAVDGTAVENAVHADTTVTMAMLKTGLLLYPAKSLAGEVLVAEIGVPSKLLEEFASKKYLLTPEIVEKLLPLRAPNAHKGDAGRVVVCAGSPGYTGAAALCTQAAVKAGAGLVSLLTPLASRDVLATKLTEVMVHGLLERMPGVLGGAAANDILQSAAKADVLALGPGLGVADGTQQAVREVLTKCVTPVVIDADALTALQEHTELLAQMQEPKALTPHVGEMARLTGLSAEEIDRDRVKLAAKYAQEWQAVLVLKGAPTVVGCPDGSVYVNVSGSNALATGGSGDVLTGLIAGLAAQGISLQEAAVCGVYLHGLASELAETGIGLAAGELATFIPEARELVVEDAGNICIDGIKMLK